MTSMSAINREDSCDFVDVAASGCSELSKNTRVQPVAHQVMVAYDGASIDNGSMGFERHESLILRQ